MTELEPTMGQLRKRVWHARNVLHRRLEDLAIERPAAQADALAALVHAAQARLELALAELHAHPDWRGK